MRCWSALVVVLLGCNADNTVFPIQPGGPTVPNGGGQPDGGVIVIPTDGGSMITGRACLLVDPRDETTCAPTGAGGLLVTLGSKTALTLDNGTFVIGTPQSTNLTWLIESTTASTTAIVPSSMGFSATPVIPVIAVTTYMDLEAVNGVTQVAGEGALFARVVSGGLPVANVTGTTTPVAAYPTFYDSTATLWNLDATGARGLMWIPGIAVGAVTLTITLPAGAGEKLVTGIPIGDTTLTFVTVEL